MKPRLSAVDTTGRKQYPEEALSRIAGLPVELASRPARGREELLAACSGADIILVSAARITREVIQALPSLKGIIRYGVGLDGIDLEAASERGIEVANVQGFGVSEMAEHCVGLILNLARKITFYGARVKTGGWGGYSGDSILRLKGRTAGIIGLGAVGKALASRLFGLEMRVLAHDPLVSAESACGKAVMVELDRLLAESDVVSVNCSLNETTRGMLGEREFGLMKKNALVINTSRGGVIDERALICALAGGGIAGAGLDVLEHEPPPPDSPLPGMENVIITPHMSWYSVESAGELVAGAFEQLRRMVLGLAGSGERARG